MNLYPAIKAKMGQWTYYIVRMTMADIANEVHFQWRVGPTLGEAIQRELNQSRAKNEITRFLQQDYRFFSSIVVAALGGNPKFHPVSIENNPQQEILAAAGVTDAFGMLTFDGGQKYYALDGQHRLKAIKELQAIERPTVKPPEGFDADQMSVMIICADEDDHDFYRQYRRLFAGLNRYAKKISHDTEIIMDEDDRFAILTRRLITDHPFFQEVGKVQTKGKNLTSVVRVKEPVKQSVRSPAFTTLQTLYAMNQEFLYSHARKHSDEGVWAGKPKDIIQIRPSEEEMDALFDELKMVWDALFQALPDLKNTPSDMRGQTEQDKRAHSKPDTDHLLFWPIGQEALAMVVRELLDGLLIKNPNLKKKDMVDAFSPLARINWKLNAPPWRHAFLVQDPGSEPAKWNMLVKDRDPARKMFTKMVLWLIDAPSARDYKESALKDEWLRQIGPSVTANKVSKDEVEGMWKKFVKQKQRN